MLRQSGFVPGDEERVLRPPQRAALPLDSRARAGARSAIAILVVLLALWVARDFLVVLIWAAVIAIAIWPIYIQFAMLPFFAGRSAVLAPLLSTLLIGLILLVPALLAVHQLAPGRDRPRRPRNGPA